MDLGYRIIAIKIAMVAFLTGVFVWWYRTSTGKRRSSRPRDAGAEGTVYFDGTVVYLPYEQGGWCIVTYDGAKYEPLTGLAVEYRVAGLRVRGTLRLRTGGVNLDTGAKPADLLQVERAED